MKHLTMLFFFLQYILKTYHNLEYSNIWVLSKSEVKKPKPLVFSAKQQDLHPKLQPNMEVFMPNLEKKTLETLSSVIYAE